MAAASASTTKFDALTAILARNVKVRRSELALSQEKLAIDSNTERMQISMIERQLGNPTLKTLQQIAEALGTDVGRLLSSKPSDW